MNYPLKDRHLYRINGRKGELGIFLSGSTRRFVTTACKYGHYSLGIEVHREDHDRHGTALAVRPMLANVPDFRMQSQFRVHTDDQARVFRFLKNSLLEHQRKVGPNYLSQDRDPFIEAPESYL